MQFQRILSISHCQHFSEPTEEEINSAITEEDSKRAKVSEILIAKGEADTDTREMNGREAPLHLSGMNGYAKVEVLLLLQTSLDRPAPSDRHRRPNRPRTLQQRKDRVKDTWTGGCTKTWRSVPTLVSSVYFVKKKRLIYCKVITYII